MKIQKNQKRAVYLKGNFTEISSAILFRNLFSGSKIQVHEMTYQDVDHLSLLAAQKIVKLFEVLFL